MSSLATKEYFKGIDTIKFEGKESRKHFEKDKEIATIFLKKDVRIICHKKKI